MHLVFRLVFGGYREQAFPGHLMQVGLLDLPEPESRTLWCPCTVSG